MEPPEATLAKHLWRLYVFKAGQQIETIDLHVSSHFLLGRRRDIVHIPLDHPTCSLQHAVIQFRAVLAGSSIPYLVDLGSTNRTRLNGRELDAQRYYELRAGDMLQFGHSSREYILMNAGEIEG